MHKIKEMLTKFLSKLLIATAIYGGIYSTPALADDINLSLHQISIANHVTVTIYNNSNQDVSVETAYVELNDLRYENRLDAVVSEQDKVVTEFDVEIPTLPGSYPIEVTVTYLNEGQTLSITDVGIFYFRRQALLDEVCSAQDSFIDKTGEILLEANNPDIWRLILPDEIKILGSSVSESTKRFRVRTTASGFRNSYLYFAVAERDIKGIHHTALCKGTLWTGITNPYQNRGRMPSNLLLLQIAFFFIICFYIIFVRRTDSRLVSAIGKYSSRMILLAVSYYVLKNIDMWLENSLLLVNWDKYRYFVDIAVNNFRGLNYYYFFKYFIDYYWAACLIFTLPYLYYFDSKKTLEEDKYACLLKSLLSFFAFLKGGKIFWNNHSKLGFLTLCVKLFFVPLLVSWVINNTIHQINITKMINWNLHLVNAYLVALFIYVDTAVFCFGYLFEFRFLKNEIKSVEPTILGWLVCLWCYPPFNLFSFKIFDYQLISITQQYPTWINVLMTCLITFLWGIFAWASVALGFKASNLTNRGIVRTGPYRYVRHPAYAAKVLIWYIQGIFFGQYFIGIMLGFTLIYILRAWTEERHLLRDPDYVEYKQIVRWKYIPRVI
jgi:protein-S-isoprenylcysteine O-methyltransferase Ste14